MMKKLLFSMAVVALTAMSSCSKGDSDDIYELAYNMPKPSYDNPSTTIPSLDYSFHGVWTVDNSAADTVNARVITGEKIPKSWADGKTPIGFIYKNYIAYDGFPYMAIMKKIAPDVKVAKITYDMRVGGLLPADEALLLKTIVAHGDNYSCIETYVAKEYLCEGISESSLYLVLKPAEDQLLLYLPFVVTTDQGKLISVTATVHPNYSKAVLKTDGTTFTSTLTLTHIEYKEVSEFDEVTKEMKLEPEMTLKYTSIKRIDSPLSGN